MKPAQLPCGLHLVLAGPIGILDAPQPSLPSTVRLTRTAPARTAEVLMLNPSNEQLARGVVLHGGAYVSDNDSHTDNTISGRSEGCLVVDDRYIDRQDGGELIDWLKNGSIGVAHHGGRFQLPG